MWSIASCLMFISIPYSWIGMNYNFIGYIRVPGYQDISREIRISVVKNLRRVCYIVDQAILLSVSNIIFAKLCQLVDNI